MYGEADLELGCIHVEDCEKRETDLDAKVLTGCRPEPCGTEDAFEDYFLGMVKEAKSAGKGEGGSSGGGGGGGGGSQGVSGGGVSDGGGGGAACKISDALISFYKDRREEKEKQRDERKRLTSGLWFRVGAEEECGDYDDAAEKLEPDPEAGKQTADEDADCDYEGDGWLGCLRKGDIKMADLCEMLYKDGEEVGNRVKFQFCLAVFPYFFSCSAPQSFQACKWSGKSGKPFRREYRCVFQAEPVSVLA